MANYMVTFSIQGVPQLTTAVDRLNKSLNKLGNTMSSVALRLNVVANKMTTAAQDLKDATSGVKINVGGGGGRSSPTPSNQRWNSNFFFTLSNLFRGNVVQAILTLLSRKIQDIYNKAIKADPQDVSTLGKVIIAFSNKFFLIGLALASAVATFKFSVHAFESANRLNIQAMRRTYTVGGIRGDLDKLKGLAQTAGIPLEKLVQEAGTRPGFTDQYIAQLRSLVGMHPRAVQYSARALNIDPEVAGKVARLSMEEFEKLFDYRDGTKALEHWSLELEKSAIFQSQAIQRFWKSLTFNRFAIAWNYVTGTVINRLVDFGLWLDRLIPFNRQLEDAGDELNKAAQNLNEAARTIREGVIGSARAKNAVPPAWLWSSEKHHIVERGDDLGAYQL